MNALQLFVMLLYSKTEKPLKTVEALQETKSTSMKLNPLLLCLAAFLSFSVVSFAQDAEEEVIPEGWRRGAGLGADLGQLLQFNPRIGGGENRLGVGGNLTAFASLKRGRLNWDNNFSLNLAVQKLGQGVLPPGVGRGADETIPYQKSIDEIRIASQFGYSFSEGSVWGYGAEATFLTQLLPTFQDAAGRNILKDIDGTNGGTPIAQILSSGTFTVSPGITYRPTDNFNVLFSPLSYKTVFVANEEIRALAIYDFLDDQMDGNRVLNQLGASVRANYMNTYLENDRLLVKSSLGLFSNYLNNPQNVDIDWRTEIGFEIIKGLTASLNTTVLYDDDLKVQISDYDAVGGFQRNAAGDIELGKRTTLVQQLLLKYAVVF